VRGLAAAALLPLALALPAPAPADSKVTVELAAAEKIYVAGKPARVRLSIANAGPASLHTNNSVVFGVGMKVTPAEGAARTVGEAAAPANARQALLLPAGTTLTTTIDLAPLLSEPFARRGRLKVELEVAGFAATPLELEVHPDWTGWNAVLETSLGEMELEFFPEQAPITVANFLELAESGFYDGLSFHRVVKGFMVQGGCPNGDGTGDGPRTIPLEAGRTDDAPKHLRGTISMAHKADPDSGSCQFFVCHRDQPVLNGNYAAFGRVVSGLETLDAIAEVPCAMAPGGPDNVPSRPKSKITITKVRLVPPPAGGAGGNGGSR
jgi:peptidyl-prolyl cis-trans isomerase B (cyclophilin B)